MDIIVPTLKQIPACAQVYISAYRTEPWNEVYQDEETKRYIAAFLNSNTRKCFALSDHDQILGIALGLVIPSIPCPYFRIEDFCIASAVHRKGYGHAFMELLFKEIARLGCDSILLGTQKGYPSHQFYLKNGFQEIESVLLYKEVDMTKEK